MMNYNLKSGKLLRLLAEKHLSRPTAYPRQTTPANQIGLSLQKINKLLRVNNFERELVVSKLLESNEIIPYELGEFGYIIDEDKGYAAIANRKYYRQNLEDIFKPLKTIAIVISIIGVVAKIVTL